MDVDWRSWLQQTQWTLGYRFAALSLMARLTLLGLAGVQILLLALLLSQQEQISQLNGRLHVQQLANMNAGEDMQRQQRDWLERFHAFLPNEETTGQIVDGLHQAAREAGITLQRFNSQPAASSSLARHLTLNLQVQGEAAQVERFILIALLEHDSLALQRWSYRSGTSAPASSTLDFELLLRP